MDPLKNIKLTGQGQFIKAKPKTEQSKSILESTDVFEVSAGLRKEGLEDIKKGLSMKLRVETL
jgi:hypothetical protein